MEITINEYREKYHAGKKSLHKMLANMIRLKKNHLLKSNWGIVAVRKAGSTNLLTIAPDYDGKKNKSENNLD